MGKRQTIPIVCIVHFIITQYTQDSKQKFSIAPETAAKPIRSKADGFCMLSSEIKATLEITLTVASNAQNSFCCHHAVNGRGHDASGVTGTFSGGIQTTQRRLLGFIPEDPDWR